MTRMTPVSSSRINRYEILLYLYLCSWPVTAIVFGYLSK